MRTNAASYANLIRRSYPTYASTLNMCSSVGDKIVFRPLYLFSFPSVPFTHTPNLCSKALHHPARNPQKLDSHEEHDSTLVIDSAFAEWNILTSDLVDPCYSPEWLNAARDWLHILPCRTASQGDASTITTILTSSGVVLAFPYIRINCAN